MQLRNHITDNAALFKIIKQKLNHDDRKTGYRRDFLFLIAKTQSCADGYGFFIYNKTERPVRQERPVRHRDVPIKQGG